MGWVHNASQAVDDESQWPTILAVVLVLTIIMATTVGLKFYVRGFMLQGCGPDDWVILFSCICSIIYSGLAIGQTRWGLGLNLPDRPKVNLNHYSIINFAGRPFYMAGITGFKVALCISYLRILSQSKRIYKQTIWVIMISCIVLHLAGTLVLILQCKPIKRSWHPLTPGTCLPNDKTFYALAAVTIFYDCIIFLLPIPILLQLHINARRKAALIALFVLGLFTTICSIMRMIQIISISKTGNSTMLVLWGTIEMNVGIFLTCIPTLTPLFTYFREKSASRTYDSNNKHSHANPHQNSHSLNILRSQHKDRSRITESSSEPWIDRDSQDNDSQREIINTSKIETTNSFSPSERSDTEKNNAGIMATTRVEVSVEQKAEDGVEKKFRQR